MPTKTFSGSLINYGTTLPDATTTPDGALFFKASGGDRGLYLFSFVQDNVLFDPDNPVPTIGDQSAQAWVALTGAAVPGGADGVLTINGGGAGAAPGATFNGLDNVTISYNTVGAPSTSGAGAVGTWGIGISGNAATATKLATARKITLTGAVQGEGNVFFDGTADVTIDTTFTGGGGSGSYVPLSGGTMTGALTTTALAVGSATMPVTGSANFSGDVSANGLVISSGVTGTTIGTIVGGPEGSSGSIQVNGGGGYLIEAGRGRGREGTAALPTHSFLLSSNSGMYMAGTNTLGWSTNGVQRMTLDDAGNLSVTGNVTAYSASDGRLKRDIETIEGALDKVKALRGVNYTMKDSGRRETGLIAQEVLQVVPEVVREGSDGVYGISYGNLVGLLVEALKEQQAQLDRQQALIDDLVRRMA